MSEAAENLEDENLEYEENYEEQESQDDNEPEAISKEEYEKLKEEFDRTRQYLEKANKEAKNYRLKAKEYEEAGMSPEEIKELREKQQKAKEKELERKGEWEKLKSQLQDQFESEKQQYEQKLQQMQSTLEKNLIQKEVTSAISNHDGITSLLRPHVESAVQLVEEEDGNMVPRVVDTDGSPKFNNKGDYMTVDEYVESLKQHEDFGVAFKGRGQSGGGTKGAGTGGAKPTPKKKRGDMSEGEKREYISNYGFEAYEQLPI